MTIADFKPMNFDWDSIKLSETDKKYSSNHKIHIVLQMMRKALDFYDLKSWSIRFDKAKKRAGQCSYRERRISLSAHFVELNSYQEIENTIKHEIAHALSYIHFGVTGHGVKWQRLAIAIGDDGKRCYDSAKVSMPKGKYVLVCPNEECKKEFYFHKKLSSTYACTVCCKKYNRGKFTQQYALKPITA
jgi:predicted SprT family Zn-dependent metalloprotease